MRKHQNINKKNDFKKCSDLPQLVVLTSTYEVSIQSINYTVITSQTLTNIFLCHYKQIEGKRTGAADANNKFTAILTSLESIQTIIYLPTLY